MTATPVFALSVAMVEPPFGTPLMPVVGAAALLTPGLVAAVGAAIALAAITGNTNEEHGLALCAEAHSLPENYGFLGRRHASSQAGLDNGTCFVAG